MGWRKICPCRDFSIDTDDVTFPRYSVGTIVLQYRMVYRSTERHRLTYTFHGLISFLSFSGPLALCVTLTRPKGTFNWCLFDWSSAPATNRRMRSRQLNPGCTEQVWTCRCPPAPPSSWALFSSQCNQPTPYTPTPSSGHSNTGKLSTVPSVGQRRRFCPHLKIVFLNPSTDSSRDLSWHGSLGMENRGTELELINKHLLGESTQPSTYSPFSIPRGKSVEKVPDCKKCKLCGVNAGQRGRYRR